MQNQSMNDAQFEAMMERCRQEILRYQSATPPGQAPAKPMERRAPPVQELEQRLCPCPAEAPAPPPRIPGGARPSRPLFEASPLTPGVNEPDLGPRTRQTDFGPLTLGQNEPYLGPLPAYPGPLAAPRLPDSEGRQPLVPSPGVTDDDNEPRLCPCPPGAAPGELCPCPEEAVPPSPSPTFPGSRPFARPLFEGQPPSASTQEAHGALCLCPPEVGIPGALCPCPPETPAAPAQSAAEAASPAQRAARPAEEPSAPPWEEAVPVGSFEKAKAAPLPDSPLLPLVQEAVEEAARRALPPPAPPMETATARCEGKGRISGAAGSFSPAPALAELFPDRMRESVVRVRFSAPLAPGTPDACRCQRRLCAAVDGWDGALPGFLTPVLFAQDEAMRERFDKSLLPDEESGLCSPAPFWEAVCDAPESLAAVRVLYSDCGTPASWRALEAFTPPLVWETAQGKLLARCRFEPLDAARPLSRLEAEELCGSDSDALARDLWLALEGGERPAWRLWAQLAPPAEQLADPTALWDDGAYPPVELGTLTLSKTIPIETARRWRMEAKVPASGAPGKAVEAFEGMGEGERRILTGNLAWELRRLPAELLERVLLLLSQEDAALGQALVAALGG